MCKTLYLAALLAGVAPALAQTPPGLTGASLGNTAPLTDAALNNAFMAKQDVNGDSTGQRVTAGGQTQTLGAWARQTGANATKPTAAPFNAKCDGVTDDSTAMTAWAAAITTNSVAVLPNSTCVFKTPLVFAQVNGVTLRGEGRQSQLLYTGASTTANVVTVGSTAFPANGCSEYRWTVSNIRLMSSTVMTAGDGLFLGHMCESLLNNVEVGGDLGGGNANWFNAIHFYGGNTIHMKGYFFSGSNTGELINGDLTTQFSDMFQTGGKIVHSAIGLKIAGNVGGFNIDQTDILLNNTNVLIDQSQVAVANVQIFFGPEVDSDLTQTGFGLGAGFVVADPGSGNSLLFFSGTWLASAQPGASGPGGACLWLQAGVQWRVTMSGGTMFGCKGDGLKNDSVATTVNVAGTYISNNSGYGVNNTSGVANVVTQAAAYGGNTLGNYTANVQANGYKQYGLFGGDAVNPMYGNTWLVAAAKAQNAQTIAGVANGAVGANAAASLNFVGGTANSNAAISLNDNNGAPSLVIAIGSGVGAFRTPPIVLPSFTVATLPTCNATTKHEVAAVSDANAPTWNAALVGGGAVATMAFCSGTAWTAH